MCDDLQKPEFNTAFRVTEKEKFMKRKAIHFTVFILFALILIGCEGNMYIVNDIDEREANEIVVFLASKGIEAQKVAATASLTAGTAPTNLWSITVDNKNETQAMAILNKAGLPRRRGTSLLELFAKGGLMSSDKEENIRFQAGLAEQLRGTIRKIDGVIDADVQISFPLEEAGGGLPAVGAQTKKEKITAAVYVKHLGVLEDPNSQLETKIKRLLAGSVQGLDFDNVAVISDRSRFSDISLSPDSELISSKDRTREYVSVWSVVMTKGSLSKFRTIFFTLIFLVLIFGALLAWLALKNYPQIFLLKKKKEESEQPPPPEV